MTTSLSNAINEILALFQDSNQTLTHLRYVWMALILALVVEPTIKYYQPNSLIPENTIKRMSFWLSDTLVNIFDSNQKSIDFISLNHQDEIDSIIEDIKNNYKFTDSKLTSFQIWQEALDVYSNAIKTLDFNQSLEALSEILDDCLEGYAIFPGSKGRRELFDWWLLEVVTASWYLLPPNSIYVVNNLENKESIVILQMKKMKSISSVIWSILAESKLSKLLSPDNHLSVNPVSSARVGWNEAFAKMAKEKDDVLRQGL